MSVPTTKAPQVTVTTTMITPTTVQTNKTVIDKNSNNYYRYVGCFGDRGSLGGRAMPHHVDTWKKNNNAIENCAKACWNLGYEVFGMQYFGECWSGVNASFTHAKYGNSSNCSNGIGGHWANDVYAFYCQPGYTRSQGSCQPCPVDEYQHNPNQCKKCKNNNKTWGRKAVAKIQQCTAENPIKVSSLEVNIAPSDVKPGFILTNFSAKYQKDSLVIPPLIYTITGVTKHLSRTTDVTSGDIDSCSQSDVHTVFPFCTYQHNGSITINKNFNCSEGDRFVISINVSDSGKDIIGTIVNSNGRVTVECIDVCKDVRLLYEKAGAVCSKINITVEISEATQAVVNIRNVHMISEIHVTNITGDSCSSLNITMKDGPNNVKTYIVKISGDIMGQTSLRYRFKNGIYVTGPVVNISLSSDNCNTSASLTLVTVPKNPENCVRLTCIDAVFNWTKTLGVEKCGSDPDNLRMRYGHCLVKPNITSGPQSRSVPSGTQVTLPCTVSSSIAAKITWYNGKSKMDTSTVRMDVYNQGYYWCAATNRYGTTQSGKALLVVNDYFTSFISFKSKENYPKKKNQNKNPCESCEQLNKHLTEEDESRTYKHRTTCRYWSWSKKLGIECVIYGEKKNQEDVNDYYKNLGNIVREGARKNKIEGLKIFWKSILVKDAVICFNETTGKQNIQGFFTWEPARIGEIKTVDCPLGPSGSSATRSCGGNFNTGAEWNLPDDENCGYKSKKTESLYQLSKKKIDSHNAKEFAKNCSQLFKSGRAEDMNEADAKFAAEMVEKILSVEDQINETASIVVEIIDHVMEMKASNLKANSSNMIIKSLDKVAEKIPLEEGKTSKVLRSNNLVIQANVVNPSTFKGIEFRGMNKTVHLPQSVLNNSKNSKSSLTRIGFLDFSNHKLFNEEDEYEESENERELSKGVLSSSVYDTDTSRLSDNVTLTFSGSEKGLQKSLCVFWNEARYWSDEGCFQCGDDNKDIVKCCCNHLTSFAVLFSPEADKPRDKKHEQILSIISYVGCGISLAGVVLTFLTYSLFRHLRKTNQQPILMSLCAAIALLLIVFAVGADRTSNQLGCQIVAVLLHYLTLTTVMWMGIEAYNLYLQLVKVMAIYHSRFMFKASVVAWGLPAVIVVVTLIAAVIEYNINEDSNAVFYYGNKNVCILHNQTYRMVSWFAPILAILLFNLIVFTLVIYKINCTGAMVPVDTKSNQKKRCWTALAIMSLVGLTWIFGAFAISDARIVFEYLFCIFNSLQGFFLFFFHCVRIKEVRNQWSFFVSGLGFSHRESESYPQRSRGIGESRHSSDAPYVKVKKWIMREDSSSSSDKPKRKSTLATVVDDKSLCERNKVDIELNKVRNSLNEDALKTSACERQDSHSSQGSVSQA